MTQPMTASFLLQHVGHTAPAGDGALCARVDQLAFYNDHGKCAKIQQFHDAMLPKCRLVG